jgi:hypothetical protein
VPISVQKLILGFFQATTKSKVSIPEQHTLQTWDTEVATAYIPTWGLIVDLGRLQYCDVSLTTEGLDLIFWLPKKGQGKVSRIGNLNTEQWDICPVETTKL